jgi:pantoate--beta-alanine ligase
MTVVSTIADWRALAATLPREAITGLVPTMGALHEGHGALLGEARRRCNRVVASIFVNPIQFNQSSDFELYPRTLESDVAFCAARGIDYVFAPSAAEMYPQTQLAFVDVEWVSGHLCGRYRAGHFRGVATVVLKLFQIIQPHVAFFGEKDYQQLAVVRRMVGDLNVPVEVTGVETVRELDGLAISSRNRRLGPSERTVAPVLYQALLAARQSVASGERKAPAIKEAAEQILHGAPEVRLEYFELVDPNDIQPVSLVTTPVRAALAAWVGEVRLIDNLLLQPPTY